MDFWTLNGRCSGLQLIAGRRSGAGPGSVVVSGPAGVARARLAQEVAAPERSGYVTQWGPGTSVVARIP